MANVYNHEGRLWELNTDDILVPPEKGGVVVRKIWCQMDSEADSVAFEIWNPRTAAVLDLSLSNVDITTSNTITDADTGGLIAGTTAGNWLHITDCTVAANNGWWRLKTDSSNDVQVVEIGANYRTSANVLTDGEDIKMRLRFYEPDTCIFIVNNTIGGSSSLHHPTLDFGPNGRWFSSLSMDANTGVLICVYIE